MENKKIKLKDKNTELDAEEIESILDDLAIPLNLRGYKYLAETVILFHKNSSLLITDLYKLVAKKFNTTESGVERAIRNTLKNNKEKVKKYFNLNCKINNGVIICAIERKLRRKNK